MSSFALGTIKLAHRRKHRNNFSKHIPVNLVMIGRMTFRTTVIFRRFNISVQAILVIIGYNGNNRLYKMNYVILSERVLKIFQKSITNYY